MLATPRPSTPVSAVLKAQANGLVRDSAYPITPRRLEDELAEQTKPKPLKAPKDTAAVLLRSSAIASRLQEATATPTLWKMKKFATVQSRVVGGPTSPRSPRPLTASPRSVAMQ